MLNFMLAIVVDSYAKVKEDIEVMETEQDIFSDCYLATVHGNQGVIHRWYSLALAFLFVDLYLQLTFGSANLRSVTG